MMGGKYVRRTQQSAEPSCEALEQDLLLYVHTCLSPGATRRVERHLRRCRSCQRKVNTFVAVSQSLADGVRDTESPRWTAPVLNKFSRKTPILWGVPLMLILIGLFLTVAFLYQRNVEARSLPTPKATSSLIPPNVLNGPEDLHCP